MTTARRSGSKTRWNLSSFDPVSITLTPMTGGEFAPFKSTIRGAFAFASVPKLNSLTRGHHSCFKHRLQKVKNQFIRVTPGFGPVQTPRKDIMPKVKSFALMALSLCAAMLPVRAADEPNAGAPDSPMDRLHWIKGPAKAELKSIAEIQVPEDFMFIGAKETQQILEASGNPTSGNELGLLAPTSRSWFVVFEFSNVGYVKDDDKDKLNADKLLKAIKEGTEEGNKYREKMGAPALHVTGWEFPPRYNEQTHNLEWAIRAESEGRPVINYNTRLLGRKGVMEVNLVIKPDRLTDASPAYQAILKDYSYKPGERYAEYRQGDKLAKYGLAALITGGAAAVAVKTGLFASLVLLLKKAWKVVVLGVAAVAAWLKRLINGGRKSHPTQ